MAIEWPVGEARIFERVKVRNSDTEGPGPRYEYAEPTAECGACGLALTEAQTAKHVCPQADASGFELGPLIPISALEAAKLPTYAEALAWIRHASPEAFIALLYDRTQEEVQRDVRGL